MVSSVQNGNSNNGEFSPRIDTFKKFRNKGSKAWILSHLFQKKNLFLFLIAVLASIVAAVFSSMVYVVIGQSINEFQNGIYDNLTLNLIYIAVFAIGGPCISLIHNFARELIAQRLERDVRDEFFSNLLGKSQSFHERQRVGDIMARATEDVRMLNYMVSPGISLLIQGAINTIVPVIVIYQNFPNQLLITPLGFIILFLITIRIYNRQMGPVTERLREEFGNMEATINESVSGIEVIKSLVRENLAKKHFLQSANEYRKAYLDMAIVQGRYLPFLIYGFALLGGLIHGINLYSDGVFQIGDIISYVGILLNFRFPTFISIWVVALIRMAFASSERLLDTMNQETEIDENKEGIEKEIKGTIEFSNVSFVYPGATEPTLRDLSFKIESGMTVAIVGVSGAGKTTLTKLLSRLYDVSNGKILVDEVDVRNYSLNSLRQQISYIEQDIYLFSSSIKTNIAFGLPPTSRELDEEVINAAKQAQAHDFISALPLKYDSEVGDRGVQLSGGERQRIAISRALLANPSVLIIDDATSAIDSKTEEEIQKAFKNALKDRTTIIITHRLSQIRWADLILVMDDGRITAKGTHSELMEISPEYRNIFVKKFDLNGGKI